MTVNAIRSKFNVYLNAKYIRLLPTKAPVTAELPNIKFKPFSEMPKQTENPMKHFFKTLLNVFGRNREEERLYNEIKTVLPDSNAIITPIHFGYLPFLTACFKGTHRLTPVIDAFSIILHKDLVLGGYQVPAGVGHILRLIQNSVKVSH
ncbi:hypothetical protein CHUAL_003265 [Chamberlinius hualienensis]